MRDYVEWHRSYDDAGESCTWSEHVPVDLLVLCGIFGNITDADIRQTILSIPAVVRDDGYVVWTRGSHRGFDLRPQVRKWFTEAGHPEIAFDGSPQPIRRGPERPLAGSTSAEVPRRLFSFVR